MRFEERIALTIDIPDELLGVRLPKLTLQPIVENSILHGILEKESQEGTIVVTGWEEGDDVVILISDDVIGMDEEMLKDYDGIVRFDPKTGEALDNA